MTDKTKPSPTELAILKILWKSEPLSAREIHSVIEEKLNWTNSSTRKTLERMSNKSFLKTNEIHGTKVYLSNLSKTKILANYIKDLAQRVLEVDEPLPVSMFADSKLLDKDELKELEVLLDSDEQEVSSKND
jgi:BlaI family transcriptional regulator, penicillinase repressor